MSRTPAHLPASIGEEKSSLTDATNVANTTNVAFERLDVLSKIPPRERQIVDLLYQRSAMTVSDICDSLPDRPSGSAVRTMLKRLEDKGYVRRADSERGFVYSPAVADTVARKTALSDVVRTFFNGSPTTAATALLGMSDGLDMNELDALEQMIAKARAAKGLGK